MILLLIGNDVKFVFVTLHIIKRLAVFIKYDLHSFHDEIYDVHYHILIDFKYKQIDILYLFSID